MAYESPWTDGPEILKDDETHGSLLVALRQLEERLSTDSSLFKQRHAATAEMNKYSPSAPVPLPVSLLGLEGEGLLETAFASNDLNSIIQSAATHEKSIQGDENATESELERQTIAASHRLALLYANDPTPRSDLIHAMATIATLYAKRYLYTQAMNRAKDALALTERLEEPEIDPSLLTRLHIYVALGRISQSE